MQEPYVQPYLAVRVQFDVPVKQACLLVVWPARRLIEYIDPNADVPENTGAHQFELCMRTICIACWKFKFRGTHETFGPSRWYACEYNAAGALRDRIFPPPQRASRAFLANVNKYAFAGCGRPSDIEQLYRAVADGRFRDDMFWITHILQQAFKRGGLVGEWIQSRDWYEGAVDYATTGARMAKHLLRVVEQDMAA